MDMQAELNRLANGGGVYPPTFLSSQGAANVWAGTVGLALLGALNAKAGTSGLGLDAVLNRLAGTSGEDANLATGSIILPAQMAAPVATAGAATTLQASVAFTALTPAPTSYTATSSPGGRTATGTASPLVVTGLTASTVYTFTVHASNVAGTGPESPASNSITAA